MNTDWLNHPAMQNVSPEKKEILLELINNSEGIDMNSALKLFTQTSEKMKKSGLTFTPEESQLITDILTASLSPADKIKLDAIKKMIQSQNKLKSK